MPTQYDAVNLFSGAGGWDVAARQLDVSGVGIELDDQPVAIARAAGHEVMHGSVTEVDPTKLGLRASGLIASPPCTTFSSAGAGRGRPLLAELCHAVRRGEWRLHEDMNADPISTLALEPMRWIAARRALGVPFRWIAMEQVRQVQPLWEAYADVLRAWGYSVDTAVLSAEQFGVPQTRVRSIFIASLDRAVKLPVPTHSKFYSRDPGRLDPGVKKWVSMAEALEPLGWSTDLEVVSNYGTGGNPRNRGLRRSTEPSATVTEKVGRNKVRGMLSAGGNNTAGQRERPLGEPSATITGVGSAYWMYNRPATTVNGDYRVSAPGRHDPAESGSQQRGAVRVTVEEAAALQTFPANYPWHAARTQGARYKAVGNAIPCLLAKVVLNEVID